MDKAQQDYRERFPDIQKKYLELRTASRQYCKNFPKGFHEFPKPKVRQEK